MGNKDEREMILADLISRDNAHNGYYKKLEISKLIDEAFNSRASVLSNLREKINTADELIKEYQLEGNDLNNKIAFEELQAKVNSLFKLKFNILYIIIPIIIILLIIFL